MYRGLAVEGAEDEKMQKKRASCTTDLDRERRGQCRDCVKKSIVWLVMATGRGELHVAPVRRQMILAIDASVSARVARVAVTDRSRERMHVAEIWRRVR